MLSNKHPDASTLGILHRQTDWCNKQNQSQYLMVKIVWGEEEVVERNKISFKEPHQQNQVHTISKLMITEKIQTIYIYIHIFDIYTKCTLCVLY